LFYDAASPYRDAKSVADAFKPPAAVPTEIAALESIARQAFVEAYKSFVESSEEL
jgi:hypothetical protein